LSLVALAILQLCRLVFGCHSVHWLSCSSVDLCWVVTRCTGYPAVLWTCFRLSPGSLVILQLCRLVAVVTRYIGYSDRRFSSRQSPALFHVWATTSSFQILASLSATLPFGAV